MPEVPRGKVKELQREVAAAERLYKKWSDEQRCDLIERYWEGEQWSHRDQDIERLVQRYTINLFFPTIEAQIPSLLLYYPHVDITPRPTHADDPGSTSAERAKLLSDTSNTFVQDPRLRFMEETSLAIRDAHFRFGVVEVGLSSKSIDNPNVGKPVIDEDGKEVYEDDKPVLQPAKVVSEEKVYFRHIPAKRFRVSADTSNNIRSGKWAGYYDWATVDQVKRDYPKAGDVRAHFKLNKDIVGSDEEYDSEDDLNRHRGCVKVWKIWEWSTGLKYVFLDTVGGKILSTEKFTSAPSVLMFHDRVDEFYPVPPARNWVGPQDEYNETRDSQRIHRRRFYRRYMVRKGSIDPQEMEKIANGEDGVYAQVNDLDTIRAVEDAPLDAAVTRNVGFSREDFILVSGTGDESRGAAQAETATQAQLISMEAQVRESAKQIRVANWLSDIVRNLIEVLRKEPTLGIWIKSVVDFSSPIAPVLTQKVAATWQEITSDELGDFEFDVSIDVKSIAPTQDQAQRRDWTNVLSVLTNPVMTVALLSSEGLLRKTLAMYGVRSEKEIMEVKQAMMAVQMAMAAQAKPPGPEAGGPGQLPGPGPGGTPGVQDIATQISQQFGGQAQLTPMSAGPQ